MRRCLLPSIILLVGLTSACTGAPTPSASGRPDNTAMVLAEPVEPASLNPLDGYAPNGAGKIFDGLLEHQADGSLRPMLATELPVVSADGKSWTITLRDDVKFSDGNTFGAKDVVATYRSLLDPAFASPLRPQYAMLTGVDQVDEHTVRFDLGYPYAPFPNKLVLGILPAGALATPGPVARSPVNTKPIGTGPYTLVSWTRGRQLVLAANPLFPVPLGGPPKVKKVTIVFAPNDADRASRLRAGKLDGAALAPSQAAAFARSDAFNVLTNPSADLRAVSMPAHGPVTGNPAVRLALNEAVDRSALVSGPLNGAGTPASTPIPPVLPEFVEPSATFTYDQTAAHALLTQSGWVAGSDGTLIRDGVPATFTLDYPTGDTMAQQLATAFVATAKALGIVVHPSAVRPAELPAKAGTDATLISTGNPFDPDLSVYSLLDSALAGAGTGDLSGYVDPGVDSTLDAGRHQTDPAARNVAYRQFQRAYLADPAMVCLVDVDHTYVMRANWNGYAQVTDGTSQGVTWGAWWNLEQWIPR